MKVWWITALLLACGKSGSRQTPTPRKPVTSSDAKVKTQTNYSSGYSDEDEEDDTTGSANGEVGGDDENMGGASNGNAGPGSNGNQMMGAGNSGMHDTGMSGSNPPMNPPAPASGADIIVQENFESVAVDAIPSGWSTFIAYKVNDKIPNPKAFVKVTDTKSLTGKKSLHILAGEDLAQLTYPLPSGVNHIFVKANIMMTRQLGQGPLTANHESLVVLRQFPGKADQEARFGEIKGVIGTNEVPSDAVSPKYAEWYKGPVAPPNKWFCLGVEFDASTPYEQLRATIDGKLVHEIKAPEDWENTKLPAGWLKPKFVEIVIGWQSFSSPPTNEMWIDDVVVSKSALTCGN